MTGTEPKRRDRSEALGCLAIVALWGVLGLHFFADRIWDREPPVLKWVVVGFGCLVLLGLLGSVVFGKRDEKVVSLIFLAIVGLGVAFWPPREDRQAAADVDALVGELAGQGEAIERQVAALPAITDRTTGAELTESMDRAVAEMQSQTDRTVDLLGRAAKLFGRAPADKREQLGQAVHEFNQRAKGANEARDRWIQQVRARVQALKKQPAGPK